MTFAEPALLLLLLIPLLLLVWTWMGKARWTPVPVDHLKNKPSSFWRYLLFTAESLPILLLAVILLMIAGPQQNGLPEDKRVLTNIQFCLDVSGSMTARFGDGSQYDAAMKAIDDFTQVREGDAFGLTIFGNEVLHWVPLTKDLTALRLSTPFLRPELLPRGFGGTQIGKALRACNKILTERPEGDRMIVLISDGQSGDIRGEAGQSIGMELREHNIVVFAVHVGNGQPADGLYSIANITGGQVFAANDPIILDRVFSHIDQMKPVRMEPSAPRQVPYEKPFLLIAAGILLSMCLCAFGLRFTPW